MINTKQLHKFIIPVAKKAIVCFLLIFSIQFSHAGNDSNYRTYGDIGRFYIPAIAGGISLLKSDYEGIGLLYLDYVVTNIGIEALKRTFNVTRPDGGKLSFPSGHSGDAFVGAGYLHMRYGFKWAAPAYLAAGFVAHSRVYAKRHRYIDVITGAAIAIATSYFTVKPYKNMNVSVSPTNNGGASVGVKYAI